MFIGAFAGADGIPEHRRKNRLQSRDIAHHAFIDELGQHRHLAALDQRIDHFPIRRIPANEQNLFHSGRRRSSTAVLMDFHDASVRQSPAEVRGVAVLAFAGAELNEFHVLIDEERA